MIRVVPPKLGGTGNKFYLVVKWLKKNAKVGGRDASVH